MRVVGCTHPPYAISDKHVMTVSIVAVYHAT